MTLGCARSEVRLTRAVAPWGAVARVVVACVGVLCVAAQLVACAGTAANDGRVRIDGSSTVYPIVEAMAEEFQKIDAGAKVLIGVSGTGGGFKKFCNGEIDIAGASRPIKESEVKACAAKEIEFVELPVAYDGLVVAVNPENGFVPSLTVAELKKIWEPEAQGKIDNWSQVREGFPDAPLRLFGAGVDSGTYDYFTQAVVGKEHSSRGDYTSSEDDNVLVQGVQGDLNALGFFGFAYYTENRGRLKAVAIDDGKAGNGDGPILPTIETVRDGTYQPLSRPLFVYVRRSSLERAEVRAFLEFAVENGQPLVEEVGYVQLPHDAVGAIRSRLDRRVTGSLFGAAGSQVGVSIAALMAAEERGGLGAEGAKEEPATATMQGAVEAPSTATMQGAAAGTAGGVGP